MGGSVETSILHAKWTFAKPKQAFIYADNSLICRDKCQPEEQNEGLANELFTCPTQEFRYEIKYKCGSKAWTALAEEESIAEY